MAVADVPETVTPPRRQAAGAGAGDAHGPGRKGDLVAPPPLPPAPKIRPSLISVTLVMALRGLEANKLRSFLTMLGVIIGVGAVIIAIAIGEGSRAAVQASISALGTNVLTIFSGSQRRGNVSFGGGSSQNMKLEDAEAILKECPSVGKVSANVNRNLQVKYKNKNNSISVNGTGKDYPDISAHPVQTGRYFTTEEVNSARRVAVLGSDAAKDLFDAQSPINKTIRVGNQNFQVIGVLKSKGGTGWRNPDDAVYVPVKTAMRRLFGQDNLSNITAQAKTFELMGRAQTEVENVMRKQHKLVGTNSDDFIIRSQADLVETQNEQQGTFSSLITYLAIVSLFVGGIGIMNIMLVSVTERTREIGIRKAIGARRADILTQFLLEALFLSLVGGALGVAFGLAGANFIQSTKGWPVSVGMPAITLAFSFSAFVGIFFGFYPALKASKLNPIEALRYE